MSEMHDERCPECDALEPSGDGLSRRLFMKAVGGTAVTLTGLQAMPKLVPAALGQQPARSSTTPKPAEALVRELYSGLTAEQRRSAVYSWNHGATADQPAARLRFYNASMGRPIGQVYTRAQQELVERILRSISSGDDGMQKLTRGGTFDNSGSLQNCGAHIFGDPSGNQQFCWLFTGHHLTVRCDGNSEPDAAFGGPMYYGHSPDGYSQRNIFFYQTRSVRSLFDALSGVQQQRAILQLRPNVQYEGLPSVQLREDGYPGVPIGDLSADQRTLVQTVMRDVLSPYRREDADEVMDLIRRNGGMERIHIAFYKDASSTDNARWNFWRLEGPGFVWNYRILPHVHTYVNIALRNNHTRAQNS